MRVPILNRSAAWALLFGVCCAHAMPDNLYHHWASLLQSVAINDIIDIGAFLKAARQRSATTLKAQQLLVSLYSALSCAKEGIYTGRISPQSPHLACDHIKQLSTQLCAVYDELVYYDRLYAAEHARLTNITRVSEAIAHAINTADDIVRAAVAESLASHTGELGSALIEGVAQVSESFTSVFRDPTSSIVSLFRRVLLASYREFHERYGALSSALWKTVQTNEEATLELWRIMEETRICQYEALLRALCTEFLEARSCNEEEILPSSKSWNDTPSHGAIATPLLSAP